MGRFLRIVCFLACVCALTCAESGDAGTTPTSETEEEQSTSEQTILLTIPSLHVDDQKTDESTTAKESIVTTTPTTTSVAPQTPINNMTVTTSSSSSVYRYRGGDGTTCILLKVDALVLIKYKTTSGEIREKRSYVPDDAEVTGNCNGETAKLILKWPSFILSWNFAKTSGRERWYVSNMELQYELSSDVFDHLDKPAPGHYVRVSIQHSHVNTPFLTLVGKSFSCKQELLVNLTGEHSLGATVLIRDFRLQPFMFKTDDFGPEYVCSPGGVTFRDETAPIAVGSTLAIVVLLTVTGYGIYRYFKIKKVQYDTME